MYIVKYSARVHMAKDARACASVSAMNKCRIFDNMHSTIYFSYARPAQPGPNRNWLCGPCIAEVAGDSVRFGPIR